MPVQLRDYQLEALNHMKNGCILCGGVGSGKSITAIAYYYEQNGGRTSSISPDLKELQDLYIITTAQKRDKLEWEGELIPFLLSTKEEFNAYSNHVYVDSWNNIKKYVKVENAFFIFDEQRVVGKGAWVNAFLKITRKNNWILLSATPADKWSDLIPVFIANGFYKNRTEFNENHVIFDRFYNPARYVNTKRLVRLRDSIMVDMDFQRKTVSHHEDVMCNYDISAYKAVMKDRWNVFEQKPVENVSELCSALRRVCNTDLSRSLAVLEIFEKHPRAIIFYNFDYELEILRNLVYGPDVEIAEWNGHMHQEVPSSKSWVYLVQYNAGAEGWNCVATDTIIFFSQNYSYRIMEQARGRIDRMNTPYEDLYYYHLKSKSPIDIAISRAISNKKKFNESRFISL